MTQAFRFQIKETQSEPSRRGWHHFFWGPWWDELYDCHAAVQVITTEEEDQDKALLCSYDILFLSFLVAIESFICWGFGTLTTFSGVSTERWDAWSPSLLQNLCRHKAAELLHDARRLLDEWSPRLSQTACVWAISTPSIKSYHFCASCLFG